MGSLAASIASSSGFAEGWPGGVSRGSKRRAKGVYVPEAFSNVSARGTEDDCVYIGGIDRIGRMVKEEWLHKQVEGLLLSDPGRVWCDYHDYHI